MQNSRFRKWFKPSKKKVSLAYFCCLIGVFIWPFGLFSFIYSYGLYKNSRYTWAESYCLELLKLFWINLVWLLLSLGILIGTTLLAYYLENFWCYVLGFIISATCLVSLWLKTVFNYIQNIKYIYF